MVSTERLAAEPGATTKSAPPRPKWKPIVFVVLPVLITISFIAFMLASFMQVRHTSLVAGDPDLRDGVRVTANVVDVTPADRVARLRLAFVPVGKYSEDNGNFLSQGVKVTVLGGADVVHDAYEKSEIMLPADVRLPLRSGNISMYPLDRYETTMRVEVTTENGNPIATSMQVEASNPGYRVQMTSVSPEDSATRDLNIRVSRAPTTIFFAMFTSVLMLTLTILAIMSVFWLLRGGASESVRFMIPLILVLLFAFPAIRSFAPGVPPLGVLVDFFAFFWCEIALGISVIIVYAHLMREMKKTAAQKDEPEEG
jgi:hypothetical protein